jgi:peptidoglycan/LPS O-acetylase OafA/YrhL
VKITHPTNCFDFLRFLFATAVIYTHSFALLTGNAGSDFLWRLSHHQITTAAAAVAGFFILSGYLVTESLDRSRNWIEYLWKRVLRIYPAFVVACAACYLLVVPLATNDGGGGEFAGPPVTLLLRTFLLQEPLAPGAFAHLPFAGSLNGSMWTIKWEFCCYLLLPLMAAAGIMRRRILLVVLSLSVAAAFAAFSYGNIVSVNRSFEIFGGPAYGWLRCLAFFLSGVVLNRWQAIVHRGCLGLALAVAGTIALWHWADFTLLIFGPYLLYYFGFARIRLFERWSRFGDFSYGLYLYAWPIQQLIVQNFGRTFGAYEVFGLSFLLSLVCAVISWFCIERPFLKLKRSLSSGTPTFGQG